jgi:hypothetical protein
MSTLQKLKMGAITGSLVGMSIVSCPGNPSIHLSLMIEKADRTVLLAATYLRDPRCVRFQGFIFGTFSVMTRGAGPNGALSQISQTMLASGATFGLFMSVGTVSLFTHPIQSLRRPF